MMGAVENGAGLNYEPGSYRDRDGRVFYDDARNVCRALSTEALAEWDFVSQTRFFQAAMSAGRIVKSEQIESKEDAVGLRGEGWAGVLRHAAIPFVSYPYEWPFGMLKDAALLHLELLAAALDEDMTIKDGTAYNVQWIGVHPTFIDVPSFERLPAGRPWAGYRQFCQTFLFPLMLQAYRDVSCQPWLRGRLEGISPTECRNLLSLRDYFRPGVLTHVVLHAWLESRSAVRESDPAPGLSAAGFDKQLICRNVAQLIRLIRGLHWSPATSLWSDYAQCNSYAITDRQAKERFVREVVARHWWSSVWDLGCNAGVFSRIAAENAGLVVALDGDPVVVERLYQALTGSSTPDSSRILPLVVSLTDPSVGLGWRGAERKALADRGRPELLLCLGLLHHLVIGGGVPLRDVLDWLAEMNGELVVEFVTREDPMVHRLLRGRRDNYSDYQSDVFERLLAERFDVVRKEMLGSGTRMLYHATPKGTT